MTIQLIAIPNAFHLPRPNWPSIQAWVAEHVAEDERDDAWEEIARQWLAVLNTALLDKYRIEKSEWLLWFVPEDLAGADALMAFGDDVLASIVNLLGDVPGEAWWGPLVVMMLADDATYDDYESQGQPEGEFGVTGGHCVREGYVHVILRPAGIDGVQLTLIHEITHACLAHLTLPLWLEEGVTQFAEAQLHSLSGFDPAPEHVQNVRRYWHEHGLQDFWWGAGFSLPDEGQRCSYDLARILFQLLVADHRPQLPALVRAAHADDAGDDGARTVLGRGVADLAAQFLGPGDWAPMPKDALAYLRRGDLRQTQHRWDDALADYAQGIALAPQHADGYLNRGQLMGKLLRYEEACADYRKALQINPRHALAHNNLAWLLATCPDEFFRNGDQAVEHALLACEFTGHDVWYCLGTLAASYAQAGDFEEARRWAKESLRRAPPEEQAGCKERLARYRQNQPVRER